MNAMFQVLGAPCRTMRKALAIMVVIGVVGYAAADERIYQQVARNSVFIHKNGHSGTGVVVDKAKGWIATAAHVVAGEVEAGETDLYFANLNDKNLVVTDWKEYRRQAGKAVRAKIIFYSKERDLAILEVPAVPKHVDAIPLSKDGAQPAQRVGVVGNSDLDQGGIFSFVAGDVRNRIMDGAGTKRVLHTAATNPGDSGGPVFNMQGQLVAIVSDGTTGYSDAQALYLMVNQLQAWVNQGMPKQLPKVPHPGRTEQVRDRSVDVAELASALNLLASEKRIEGVLNKADPKIKIDAKQCHHKVFRATLKAGNRTIELESGSGRLTANGAMPVNCFDTFLMVKEVNGKNEWKNDDRGDGSRNSRVTINVPQDTEVDIIATSCFEDRVGRFMIRIR